MSLSSETSCLFCDFFYDQQVPGFIIPKDFRHLPDGVKLDNPVWYSLPEANKNFAIVYGDAQFYQGTCHPGLF
jgi:hypothetical protein